MDYKPLTFALKQARQSVFSPTPALELYSQITSDIQHVSGNDNVVGDPLPRVAEVKIPTNVDFPKIAEAQ